MQLDVLLGQILNKKYENGHLTKQCQNLNYSHQQAQVSDLDIMMIQILSGPTHSNSPPHHRKEECGHPHSRSGRYQTKIDYLIQIILDFFKQNYPVSRFSLTRQPILRLLASWPQAKLVCIAWAVNLL